MIQITSPYKIFETERLWLKPAAETDAAFILSILNMPKWLKYIGDRKVYTEEQAADYIRERMLPQLEQMGVGNNIVISKADGKALGVCGIYARPGLDIPDIGFAFLPDHEGHGYAYEAANRLIRAAREEFHLTGLSAITVKDNLPSQKLLSKLGLQYKKEVVLPGSDEHLLYYELTL